MTMLARVALGVVALIVALAAGGIWLYREALRHGFSAREDPWPVEAFVARRLRSIATGLDAKSMNNPLSPSAGYVEEGLLHFQDHCATCHAPNGSGETLINSGLYPPAPDLRESPTQVLSDGELFQVIRNGIRFTGMPGTGDGGDETWKLVLAIRRLPSLSATDLDALKHKRETESAPAHTDHSHRH